MNNKIKSFLKVLDGILLIALILLALFLVSSLIGSIVYSHCEDKQKEIIVEPLELENNTEINEVLIIDGATDSWIYECEGKMEMSIEDGKAEFVVQQ